WCFASKNISRATQFLDLASAGAPMPRRLARATCQRVQPSSVRCPSPLRHQTSSQSASVPVNPCKGGPGESEICKKINVKARNPPEITGRTRQNNRPQRKNNRESGCEGVADAHR